MQAKHKKTITERLMPLNSPKI